MKEECRKWHMHTISLHSQSMFDSLLYPEHIISPNMKEILDFNSEDSRFDASKLYRGYFARKDKTLYWLDGTINFKGEDISMLDLLPIRIKDSIDLTLRQDVVREVTVPVPFSIRPEKTFPTVRQFITEFLPFEHSHPTHFLLQKIMAIMGIVGKTFVCIASEPGFSKSSVYEVMHSLTDRCPVYKPRSVPGVLNKINSTGNIIFDEIHDCKKEVREILEEFSLQIGGGKPVYINGAMKSGNTKNKYDCVNQSITYLYNNVSSYSNPEKEYFEYIFSNNKAMGDRFLKLRLDGILLPQQFDKEFNLPKEAEDNKMYYINIAKELEYLAQIRREDRYERRWETKGKIKLTNRQRMSFDEMTWLMDGYCQSQEEYDKLITVMNDCISNYQIMVGSINCEEESV